MLIAIIPAKNEAAHLRKVISNLPTDTLNLIIPVLNGCSDYSLRIIEEANCPYLNPLCFAEPLGIDVPRSVGAVMAKQLNASGVLFLDGDMHGVKADVLRQLINAIENKKMDLALTNCYPPYFEQNISSLAYFLLEMRTKLNRHLQLQDQIGHATPSHGPHAVSKRLLNAVNPKDFAIPPLLLANAARTGMKIGLAAEIPHLYLGSPLRGHDHTHKIVETIIGDCLSALHAYNGKPGNRIMGGHEYIGYHHQRRFDLLEKFTKEEISGDSES